MHPCESPQSLRALQGSPSSKKTPDDGGEHDAEPSEIRGLQASPSGQSLTQIVQGSE
jgi:hypothetical protein